jgi:hypothetical protein
LITVPLTIAAILIVLIALPTIRTFLWDFFGYFPAPRAASVVQRLPGTCPHCGGSFSTHEWAEFAVTVAKEKTEPRTLEFLEHLKHHRFEELHGFHEFEGTENAIVAYVVRCQAKGGVVFAIVNPFELGEDDWILAQESVNPSEMREIDSLLKPKFWHYPDVSPK